MASGVCKAQTKCSLAGPAMAGRKKMMVAVYEAVEFPVERHSSAVGSSAGTPIRVCSGRLKSACNPGVCDCPDMECKVRKKKGQIVWMLMKLAIFGYALEETHRYGVWSDADKTEELSQRYLEWANGFFSTRNKIIRTPEQIYDMAIVQYNFKNAWNNTVIAVNEFIASVPDILYNFFKYIFPKKPAVPEEVQ